MGLVIIRTTANTHVGLGHVRRTLTLAQALVRAHAAVTFLFEGTRAAAQPIVDAGFEVIDVTKDPDRAARHVQGARSHMVVVDVRHGADDLHLLRSAAPRVGVIDDLGDPPVDADLVTNSAFYAEELPYRQRPGTVFLLGPRYALLREAFAAAPPRRSGRVRRALITLGGSDPTNLTPRLVGWTRAECPDVEVVVVAGPFFTNLEEIRAARPSRILINPPDMRDVMCAADLAVSGGGQTTYELAATASAVLAMQVADDQRRNLEALSRAGVLAFAGTADDPALEARYRQHLARITGDADARAQMGQAGRALVDGRGADRVAAAILQMP